MNSNVIFHSYPKITKTFCKFTRVQKAFDALWSKLEDLYAWYMVCEKLDAIDFSAILQVTF